MGKKVPLVKYENGKRIVIGEAEVEEVDGVINVKASFEDGTKVQKKLIDNVSVFPSGHENAFSMKLEES